MPNKQSLEVVIKARDDASKELKKLENNLDNLAISAKKHEKTFAGMAGAGTIAFGAISAGIFAATQLAADSQEVFNKFDVVFDDVGNAAEKAAKELTDSWGMASHTSKALLSDTGDLLTGLGFTGDEALKLSDSTVKMAADLASFQNVEGGVERASKLLTKGLLGEREGLKELGIVILDADIKQRLLEKGMDKLTGTALLQAKAEVTLQLVREQSQKAMGDYQRTAGSLVNQQRELQQRLEGLTVSFGTLFIPMLNSVVDAVMPVIETVTQWINQNPELTKQIVTATLVVAGLVAGIGFLGLALPSIIAGFGFVGTAIAAIASPITLIVIAIAGLVAGFVYLWKTNETFRNKVTEAWHKIQIAAVQIWEDVKKTFSEVWKAIISLTNDALRELTKFWDEHGEDIMKSARYIWAQLMVIIKTALKVIKDIIHLVLALIRNDWEEAWNRIKSIFSTVWEGIKSLAKNFIGAVASTLAGPLEAIKQKWQEVWGSIKQYFRDTWEGIGIIINNAIDGIMRRIDPLLKAVEKVKEVGAGISGKVTGAVTTVKTTAKSAWEQATSWIPRFADGGVVPGALGQPVAAIVHGGETVVPLGGKRTSGITVNLNIAQFMGTREFAEQISDILTEQLRYQVKI